MIAQATQQQGAATAEISSSVMEVVQGTSNVAENIGVLKQTAGETSDSASSVRAARKGRVAESGEPAPGDQHLPDRSLRGLETERV
jgi:methyl-accepting chemotaxis protein